MAILNNLTSFINASFFGWWKDLFTGATVPVDNDSVKDLLDHTAPAGNVGIWFVYSVLPLILTVLFGLILYRLLIKNDRGAKWLKRLFIAAWVISFLVYDVGTYTGQYVSFFTNAPMAVVHACESFLMGSDVSAIHEPFHNSWVFMGAFSFSHAFSALVSMLFLMKYFGFNIVQKLRMYRESKRNKRKETFVFWGLNKPTFELIESINDHFKNNHELYRIIVVKTEEDKDEGFESKTGFNRIFEFISMNDAELEKLSMMKCLTCASNSGLGAVKKHVEDVIGRELRLTSLRRILTPANSAGSIRLFFLSEDENKNIRDILVLRRDKTLAAYMASDLNGIFEDRKVEFYCHARYNSVHRVLDVQLRKERSEIHIVDSSHINVELLKTDRNVLPVNFVNVEAEGTVSSMFNGLIVGFSEVGLDLTRYLYEYGAFVKKGTDETKAERSDFHLDVVDKDMANKAGAFIANTPAIKPYMPFLSKEENKDSLLELHNLDANSVEFYNLLKDRIKTLNYIAVATEDDELNMTLAVRILKLAIRYRPEMKNLCILVRIHNDDDGYFKQIEQYYNKLWAAQEATGSTSETSNDKFLKSESATLPLYIFGQDVKVYTYQNIIDDQLTRKAKEYKDLYETLINPVFKPNKEDGKNAWDREVYRLLQIDRIFHHTYAGVMKLRRTQSQDISNSQHALTKTIIAEESLAKIGKRPVDWKTLDRKLGSTAYFTASGEKVEPDIQRLLMVLAQTEHLRWCASHEILGYVEDENKDESRLTHNCLKIWCDLDEETRSYDCNVVDLSLGIKETSGINDRSRDNART